METTIDSVVVEIESNANNTTDGLQSLISTLERLERKINSRNI